MPWTTTRHVRLARLAVCGPCAVALLTSTPGCGSTPDEPLVSAGLERFADAESAQDAESPPLEQVFADNADQIERFAAADGGANADSDGQAGLDGFTLAANPAGSGARLEVPIERGAGPTPLNAPAQGAFPLQGPPADAAAPLAGAARPTLQQAALDELVRAVAQRLERSAEAPPDPLARAVQLSLLDALSPGSAPSAADAALALTPEERAAVNAWRSTLTSLGEAVRAQGLDGPSLIGAAVDLGESARELQPLRIDAALLARRVEGFGRYAPLPTPLLAGRPHPAGLYVEVSGFARAPSVGPDGEAGYVVELGEEVSLYHEPDGLLAWRRPEQIVRDFSRRPRRDFFLVDRLDLPSTLTVGSYRLKVRVSDKATGASAEAIIPFEVVADRSLAGTKR